jgi:adenylate cyclase
MIDIRRVRLVSGLTLGAFLLTHLLNHALGLVSLAAMETGRVWFVAVWQSWPGTVALYGAVAVHFAVALVALYRRRTLRMPLREALQYAFGLALPFLVVGHAVATRGMTALSGQEARYADVVYGLWIAAPGNGAKQAVTLLLAWAHVCLGIWFWLNTRTWFRTASPVLFAVALLVPVLALLGFAEAGTDLVASGVRRIRPGDDPELARRLGDLETPIVWAFAATLAAGLGARGLRAWRGRSSRVRVRYPGGQTVTVPAGWSVLEASRIGRVPHVSVCGGRGRCSTCRVRVIEGHAELPEPGETERATLARVGAGPHIRLACQLRPTADVTVAPAVNAAERGSAALRRIAGPEASRERDVAILFCDLRGFTRLSEGRLPFDTVFVLNRFFEVVGEAVEAEGGHLDKFIGDGALALFGLSEPLDVAAAQALRAASRIGRGLAELNRSLADELGGPLRIAMGLHAGPAIVGAMGYGDASTLTAVGDTINTASRLEGVAKELDAELVVSAELAAAAGMDSVDGERRRIPIRGREAAVEVIVLPYVSGVLGLRAGG